MAISGVGQNFCRNNVETKGNTKIVGKAKPPPDCTGTAPSKPFSTSSNKNCFFCFNERAEKYFGGVNIKVKGDVFHVTVMLQQGETGEDK